LRGAKDGVHVNVGAADIADLTSEEAARPQHLAPVLASDPAAPIEPTRVQIDPVTGIEFVEYDRGSARTLRVDP
jgi:hypothetical protein